MPQGRPEAEVNKEALNAFSDLYYLYIEMIKHAEMTDLPTTELDVFFMRGGLKTMLHKYHPLAVTGVATDGLHEEVIASLQFDSMLPSRVNVSEIPQAIREQMYLAKGDLKILVDRWGAHGTPIPAEVTRVLEQGNKILDARRRGITDNKPRVIFSASGAGVPGDASKHYALRGGRKKAVMQMLEQYPETLSAKAWARLVGKVNPASSDSIQQVSSDAKNINKRFKTNLQLNEDLIINRNGYLLNFEELDIQKSD